MTMMQFACACGYETDDPVDWQRHEGSRPLDVAQEMQFACACGYETDDPVDWQRHEGSCPL